MQQLDNQYIGIGEVATYNILKHLTHLKPQSLKDFKSGKSGIYKQVPLQWIISRHEFELLSDAHKKGSIDLFIIYNQIRIAIRVQGNGHGSGLKGIGKVKHDTVQANLLDHHCQRVDIHKRECPNVFKERVTNEAIEEIKNSFKTSRVLIPVC